MIDKPSPNHQARKAAISIVVVHASAGVLAGDLSWIQSPKSQVSYHVLVGLDGTAYRLVQDDRAAWHADPARMGPYTPDAVNLNHVSLGIAASHPNDGRTPYPEAQVRAMAAVVALWLNQYPIQAVTSHAACDVRKSDPRAFPWRAFWEMMRP